MDLGQFLSKKRRLHFVGSGGSGMFPLVQILHNEGHIISGSDVNDGDIIAAERRMGIPVAIGHAAENVEGADALVVTAALLPGNPEIIRAEKLNIPIIRRAELLGYITSRFKNSICISGTHGKTTTTSMVTSIFMAAGRDPAAVIGGKLPLIGGYGRAGSGDVMVCEACEYVDTFLELDPAYALILNVDADHLDYFGTLDAVKKSFRAFAELARVAVVANADDENTRDALAGVCKNIVWFGESEGCDYRISNVENTGRARYRFLLTGPDGKSHGPFLLTVPGRHNICNAAAAAAVSLMNGCDEAAIASALLAFGGAGRRFEILGEYAGVTVVDDYAHHPAEIEVTLSAAQDMGYREVWAVFQPFTFSRTKTLLQEFADALMVADHVVLTEIMGSREKNTFGVYTTDLAERIPDAVWFKEFEDVAEYCAEHAKENDLVITLGCGDVYKAARMIADNLAKKEG